MSKQCDYCGKVLTDNAIQSCPGCGKKVASFRPARRPVSNDPPSWMKQLESSLTDNRSKMPLRELNVKVWNEEVTRDLPPTEYEADNVEADLPVVDTLPTSPLMVAASSTGSNTPAHTPPGVPGIAGGKKGGADQLPTNPHMTSPPQNRPSHQASSLPGMNAARGTMPHEEIEAIETRPYVAQPRNVSPGVENPLQSRQRQVMQTPPRMMRSPAMQRPVTPGPLPIQFPPAQAASLTPPASMPVPPQARVKKHNRKGLVILFGFLLILLLGGAIAWVIIAQPFTVPEITTTTQSFTDSSTGLSLQYPRNWSVTANKQQGTVSLYDSNHTDQVIITTVAAGNQDINQYVSKTVSSLGMTGQKPLATLAFAGASWQQTQGSVQENGATFTATLFVTMHGQYYYTVLQLAPSSTYPLEEQLVFSKMRSSFQF